jgi:hypothetical protein
MHIDHLKITVEWLLPLPLPIPRRT